MEYLEDTYENSYVKICEDAAECKRDLVYNLLIHNPIEDWKILSNLTWKTIKLRLL